jgi:hypothetical protein
MTPTTGRAGRRSAAALLIALIAAAPAHALFRFNDGRDQVYVTAYVGAGYDSNVFSSGTGDNSDILVSGGAGIEYSRKAGLIGVNGRLGWDFGSFGSFSSEDYLNPRASLEFTKGTGRTTGAVQFNTRRDSRSDPTVGLRTESWNYGVNLNYRYPVIERYSIAGNIGWDRTDYVDDGVIFSDLETINIGTDLFYSWRSDRDLLAGYRVRFSDAQANSQSTDHSIYTGVSGRIYSKLSGSARVGWTRRITTYPGAIEDDANDGLYVSLASTWPATRKATFTVSATQDFNTTSTNFQTRSTSGDITGQFSHTVKFSTNATLGGGRTEYISGYGLNAPAVTPGFNGQDRTDHYLTAGVGSVYTVNSHLTVSTGYTYHRNWSTLSGFEFTRHSIDLTVSTRW